MNVIIANELQQELSNLDIDIIKTITGSYESREIVGMFKDFFFNKMILDVTAIKGYEDPNNYQIIGQQLDADKVILFIPENSKLCTSIFLSKLISFGLYNFTTNIDGIKYLLERPNTYEDVEALQHTVRPVVASENLGENTTSTVIGFRSITDNAGSTTLIYMLKNELEAALNAIVVAMEVDKKDFAYFNSKNMISVKKDDLKDIIAQNTQAQVILVDLNSYPHDEVCQEVFYLVEPSIMKLNKTIVREPTIFSRIKNKNIILMKSLLSSKDISDFELETGLKVFYNMPPLDERQRNGAINDFLGRLGLLTLSAPDNDDSGRVFGLFRR